MTHSSCISHPAHNQCLKIHLWQIIACDGDICGAAILSHLEALHNEKYGVDKYHKHINDIAELHNQSRVLDEDILIPIKLSDLRKALFDLAAEKKISESLNRLAEKGFISIHTNPDPEKILDRIKYIRFYPEVCNAWIRANYENDRSLINKSCGEVADSAKRENRYGEKAESTLPKGRIDSAKKENRLCQKEESGGANSVIKEEKHHQAVDFSDNAKWEDRFSKKAESILPKGVLYNNKNQSISAPRGAH